MRKIVIVLAVLVVGGMGAVADSRSVKSTDPGFKTVEVSRGEVVEKALAVGAIRPEQEISVKSKISGIVRPERVRSAPSRPRQYAAPGNARSHQ